MILFVFKGRSKELLLGLLVLILFFLFAFFSFFQSSGLVKGDEDKFFPPTTPVIIEAVQTGSGVEVAWVASQPGTNPLKGYFLQRSENKTNFIEVAFIDSDKASYIDPEGKIGSFYRLYALDDQDNKSIDSDTLIAKEKPLETALPPTNSDEPLVKDTITIGQTDNFTEPSSQTSSTPEEINQATDINSFTNSILEDNKSLANVPSEKKTETLDKKTQTRIDQLNQVIVSSKENLIEPVLNRYKEEKNQIVSIWDNTPPAQKQKTKKLCDVQENQLEVSLSLLPDQFHINTYEALAWCHIIRDL